MQEEQKLEASQTGTSAQVSPLASKSVKQVHRAALLASITGQPFEDTKFYVYSRRMRDGAVDTPLPLLANSTLIRKASSHFDYVFAAGFAESGVTNMDAPFPPTKHSTTVLYDYASDSDLDEEEDPMSEVPINNGVAREGIETKDGTGGSQKETEESESGSSKDIQVEDKSKAIAKPGRVVILEDIAYRTWKAFIYYAYFEEIQFAPLKSEQKSRSNDQDPGEAPLCSPKSMYRLAEKYDIASLKDRAAKDIKAKLSPHNILEEIFSTFTTLYPAIQDIELDYLQANIKDSGIQARLPRWLEAMEDGDLPKGAAIIIASLITRFNSRPEDQSGMKRCPNGCTGIYECRRCSRTS